ncbi:MAG: hypothetical protein ACK551_03180 [Vampirovibrionales bacterium]
MRPLASSTSIPLKPHTHLRSGHEVKGFHHDHDPPPSAETRWTQIGAGLALGAAVMALGHQEEVLKMARKTMPQGNKIPKWLIQREESSALLTMNPMSWLKAVGLMGSVSLVNKGLMMHLAPPLFALEIGAIFHSMIPGSIGMKTANFMTMAPLLAGSAWLASSAHGKVNEQIDQQKDWSDNQKNVAKGISSFAISGATAVGAMAVFPRVHLGLMELRNPFIKKSLERPLLGGEKGWYINTVHHVDGLVNGVRESLTTAWQDKTLKNVANRFKAGFEAPFLQQGDPKLNGADNYYRTRVPSMVKSKGIEQYTYNMLRAVPFTATSQAYRATRFGGTAKSNVEGIAKAFQPHYESEMAHMTTQDLAHKVEHLEKSLADKKHVATLKQHQAIEATLKKDGVPALILPAVVARQMLEKLDKKNPLRPAYVDLAFHGREELGRAIEAQLQAGDPIGELRDSYNKLARRYNRLGGDLVEAEHAKVFSEKVNALHQYLNVEENAEHLGFHQVTLKALKSENPDTPLSDVDIAVGMLVELEKNNPVNVARSAKDPLNLGGFASVLGGKTEEEQAYERMAEKYNQQKALRHLYSEIIQHGTTPVQKEYINANRKIHIHSEHCGHGSQGVHNHASSSVSTKASHTCDDPTHNHDAPTPNAEAHDHAHDGEGGDFFHLAMARYEMLDALKKRAPLTQDFEQARIGGVKTVQNLAEHLQTQPALLAEGSTLEQNFRVVTNALKATQQLHDKGHVAPDTAENIKDVLIQNKWDANDAKAFNDALAMYTSKADHLNGHNPQVVKAWAIMAGAGGAVCANGCCAGSIFCFNEAVALVGSLYSSITNSLHLGHHHDDGEQKKTPSVQASH